MKAIRKILVDKPTLVMLAINMLLLLICVIYLLININTLDPTATVSFRYLPNVGGEAVSGPSSQLYQLVVLPVISSLVALFMMTRFLQFNRRALALMVISLNALVLLFCFIVANSLITLNS